MPGLNEGRRGMARPVGGSEECDVNHGQGGRERMHDNYEPQRSQGEVCPELGVHDPRRRADASHSRASDVLIEMRLFKV